MRYYKEGKPKGRFIGSTERYDIYPGIYRKKEERQEPEPHRKTEQEFVFSYGPASGMLESSEIDFYTPGEIINHVDVDYDVRMRKIGITGLTPADALLRIERINGFHAASHAICFLSAVEDAMGVNPPDNVLKNRILQIESERIRSNLLVVERMAQAAGFGVPVNQLSLLREKVSRIIGKHSGHRYFYGSNSLGGTVFEISSLAEEIGEVSDEFRDIFRSLLVSKLFINRLQNNGINMESDSIGPAAKASGIMHDARMDSPDLPYGELDFKPVIKEESDAFGRFMVRSMEIGQSSDLIKKVKISNDELSENQVGSVNGKGMARIESPAGDIFYGIELKDGLISAIDHIFPSVKNLENFRKSMRGNIFTDFHFNWESYGIWISELGVVLE